MKLPPEEAIWCRRAQLSFPFFCSHCQIETTQDGDVVTEAKRWEPFNLWPVQLDVANTLVTSRESVMLKARQLGFTWLLIAFALWKMLRHPVAHVLLFSQGDAECMAMLSQKMRPMYERLPWWLKEPDDATLKNDAHEWLLPNGSRVQVFPSTKRGARSYTGTLAIIDEADWIDDLQRIINAVQPAVDAGGQLVIMSTIDKDKPQSAFKQLYRAARDGQSTFKAIFRGWDTRPGRDEVWMQRKRASMPVDAVFQEYPASDVEALAAKTADVRLPLDWLNACYRPAAPQAKHVGPAIPALRVFVAPQVGRKYVIGADTAAGNPTSNNSSFSVLDDVSGEQVACLTGKFEPATFAAHIDAVGAWYNIAAVMVERNNHGHAVIQWLREHSLLPRLRYDDGQDGWHTTTKGKALLWTATAEDLRDRDVVIHDQETYEELSSIEGSTLKAPKGQADDRAIGFGCAVVGRRTPAPAPLIPEPELQASKKTMRSPFPAGFFEQETRRNAERLRGQ
jgi:hypothetical protein